MCLNKPSQNIYFDINDKHIITFKYLDISLRVHDVVILEAVLLLLLLEGEEPPQPGIVPRHGRVTLPTQCCWWPGAGSVSQTNMMILSTEYVWRNTPIFIMMDGIILTYLTFNVNTNHI